MCGEGRRTECPLLRGPMSRKARVFSLSKILSDGISPNSVLEMCQGVKGDWEITLDNLAEYAGGH